MEKTRIGKDAAELLKTRYKSKVKESKKIYDRKKDKNVDQEE
jgi:hypothetical protein